VCEIGFRPPVAENVRMAHQQDGPGRTPPAAAPAAAAPLVPAPYDATRSSAPLPAEEPRPVARQTAFGMARLLPEVDRPGAWLLTVDGAPQSHVDLAEPEELEFEYVRWVAHAVDLMRPAGKPLRAVHLGGGALTLARYVAATRPGSEQLVAEIDGELTEFVRRHLPWAPAAINVRAVDARELLAAQPAAAADLVVVDVYRGSRIPAHLTSVEFVRETARVLRPGGLYAANLADSGRLDFVRAQLATVRAVLPQVCLVAEPQVLRGRRFGNLVLLASDAALPVAELGRRTAADAFPARVVHSERLDALIGGAAPVSDATATASPQPPEGAFTV
jgi:spermidine synthase